MPAKMARSATRPPFEVPGLRQSSAPPGGLVRKRKKRKIPRRFGVHLENPGSCLEMQLQWVSSTGLSAFGPLGARLDSATNGRTLGGYHGSPSPDRRVRIRRRRFRTLRHRFSARRKLLPEHGSTRQRYPQHRHWQCGSLPPTLQPRARMPRMDVRQGRRPGAIGALLAEEQDPKCCRESVLHVRRYQTKPVAASQLAPSPSRCTFVNEDRAWR